VISRPMKAPSESVEASAVRFPVLASYKIDGLRGVHDGGIVLSKTLKPFRNAHVNRLLAVPGMCDLDMELTVGRPHGSNVLRRAMSGITSAAGEPDVRVWVFDWFGEPDWRYSNRLAIARQRVSRLGLPFVKLLPQKLVKTKAELLAMEERALERGYEGLMLRDPNGIYKEGICTLNEGHLLKFKRFAEGEAVVTGLEEGSINGNEAVVGADGVKRRSTAKSGKTASGLVGTILGTDVRSGDPVRIAPGCMTKKEREAYMRDPGLIVGKMVTYKYFPTGTAKAPRFPTFKVVKDPDTL
jgi:DNA ligase-1